MPHTTTEDRLVEIDGGGGPFDLTGLAVLAFEEVLALGDFFHSKYEPSYFDER